MVSARKDDGWQNLVAGGLLFLVASIVTSLVTGIWICIVTCMAGFAVLHAADPDNKLYKEGHIPLVPGWESGLSEERIAALLTEEKEKHPEMPDINRIK